MESWLTLEFPEWSNDQRISALFSRFPDRSVNSQVFEARLRFWSNAIAKAARKGFLAPTADSYAALVISSDIPTISSRFQRKGLTPLGLETVVTEMRKSGALVPVSQYLNSSPPLAQGSSSWSVSGLVKSSFQFGVSLVFGSFTESNNYNAVSDDSGFVVVELVEEYAMRLYNHVRDTSAYSTDCIHDPKVLIRNAFENSPMSDLDCMILIKSLELSGKAVVEWETLLSSAFKTSRIIKVLVSSSSSSSSSNINNSNCRITEADKGILHIKTTIDSIHAQISQLDAKVEQLKLDAKKALHNGNQKQRALMYLKQKTGVSVVLDKRIASLHTLETILSRIQQAETDIEMLEAYEKATSILTATNEKLQAANVESVMSELEDAMASQTEVQDAIDFHNKRVGELNGTVGEEEEELLEKELDALIAASGEKETAEADVDDLVAQLDGLVVQQGGLSGTSAAAETRAAAIAESEC
ncbi:Snf7-domain-containing protein [Obelidium mucronatum]|nr:Snf7-domain-containing protein [Obelidium mucronatum]